MGKNSRLAAFLLVASMAMSCYACATVQQSEGQTQAASQTGAQSATVFEGSLVEVNTETKTLAVKNAENKEMHFAYTDTTEIIGADKTTQGLAGKSGETVKVTFTLNQGINQASRIEILPFYF